MMTEFGELEKVNKLNCKVGMGMDYRWQREGERVMSCPNEWDESVGRWLMWRYYKCQVMAGNQRQILLW